MTEFYQQHAPAKVDRVDELLRKYAADLDGMFDALERKYVKVVEPVVFTAPPPIHVVCIYIYIYRMMIDF